MRDLHKNENLVYPQELQFCLQAPDKNYIKSTK